MKLTTRELATISAALRYWQANYDNEVHDFFGDYFSDVAPLTGAEIDKLCEELNNDQDDEFFAITRLHREDITTAGDQGDNKSKSKRFKKFSTVDKWLEKQPFVVVGYFDNVRGINFPHLIALWLDAAMNKDEFAHLYPYAADHFNIQAGGGIEDPRTLEDFLLSFKGCYHIKVWCYGTEISLSEYQH